LATAEQCSHSIKVVSPASPSPPKASRLGVGQSLGGDIARTTDRKRPRRYFIPYDAVFIKTNRKQEREGGHSSFLSSGATVMHSEVLLHR